MFFLFQYVFFTCDGKAEFVLTNPKLLNGSLAQTRFSRKLIHKKRLKRVSKYPNTFRTTVCYMRQCKKNVSVYNTGRRLVRLWWNRATLPNTSWQYVCSSSNSSSISTASWGQLLWIRPSPNTIRASILLVFRVISFLKLWRVIKFS